MGLHRRSSQMLFAILILFILTARVKSSYEDDAPELYYYGLEESERGLEQCGRGQACSALVARYWRAPALVRLCACARRASCDIPAPSERTIPLSNRATLQFCGPVTDWPKCAQNQTALSVVTPYARMNPDEIEEKHHKNIQLIPPKITANCQCREPNHWKLISTEDNKRTYRCSPLPLCQTGEYCGNVNEDLYALYQSCMCPKNHICVYDGGLPNTRISELLYEGRGWKAYCHRLGENYSYEDY